MNAEKIFRWIGAVRAAHISAVLCVSFISSGWHQAHMTVDECADYVEAVIEAIA